MPFRRQSAACLKRKDAGIILLLALSLLFYSTGYGQVQDTLAVRFDFDRSTLPAGGKAAIESALSLYGVGRPLIAVWLSGHCDNAGSDRYNDRLSRSRIGAVRTYLQSKGLLPVLFQQMNAYGKRRPLNDNSDEEKRSLNRRVEIIFHSSVSPAIVRNSVKTAIFLPDTAAKPNAPSVNRQPQEPLLFTDALTDTAALVGKSLVLRNVNFYGDRHVPLPCSFFELERLAKLMLAHPGLQIEIQGYVCCMPETMDGYDADTRKPALSAQRAKFVYKYLIDKGISASRMSYKGFGGSHKLYPEESNERERELNRRVEIKVLGW